MFLCHYYLLVVLSGQSLFSGAEAHPGGSNWQCEETVANAKPPRRLHAGAGAPSGNARLFMMCVCVCLEVQFPGVFSAGGLFL